MIKTRRRERSPLSLIASTADAAPSQKVPQKTQRRVHHGNGHTHTHTHKVHTLISACSPHRHTGAEKHTQVGLRSVACQFVVPLVPSQEALSPASSHAKIGTRPTNTLTHTHAPTPSLANCTAAPGAALSGLSVRVCLCVRASAFLHFRGSQETNAEGNV